VLSHDVWNKMSWHYGLFMLLVIQVMESKIVQLLVTNELKRSGRTLSVWQHHGVWMEGLRCTMQALDQESQPSGWGLNPGYQKYVGVSCSKLQHQIKFNCNITKNKTYVKSSASFFSIFIHDEHSAQKISVWGKGIIIV